MFGWFERFIFGDDVFISYARADSTAYAVRLATQLASHKVSCRIDQFGTEPGKQLPRSLLAALRRCSVLVVLGSAASIASDNVRSEVEAFAATGKPMVPVDLDGTLRKAVWWQVLDGIPVADDSQRADKGTPSDDVVTRIESSIAVLQRNQRTVRAIIVGAVALATLGAAASVFGLQARASGRRAEASAMHAEQEARRSQAAAERLRQTSLVAQARAHDDPLLGALILLELGAEEMDKSVETSAAAAASRFGQSSLPIARLFATEGKVVSADLDPTGERLILADTKRARILNASGRGPAVELPIGLPEYGQVSFGATGKHVLSVGTDVRIWNPNGTLVGTPYPLQSGPLRAKVDLDPSETRLAIHEDGEIRIYTVGQPGVLATIASDGSATHVTQFYLDASHLIHADGDGMAIVDIATGQVTHRFGDAASNGGPLGPGGSMLVHTAATGPVLLWSPATGKTTPLSGPEGFVNWSYFSEDGKQIHLVTEYAETVLDAQSLQPIRREAREACTRPELVWTPTSQDYDSCAKMTPTPFATHTEDDDTKERHFGDERNGGRRLEVVEDAVTVWDEGSATDVRVLEPDISQSDAQLSDDGARLFVAGGLLDVTTGRKVVGQWNEPGGGALSPDGRWLVLFGQAEVRLHGAGNGELVRSLPIAPRREGSRVMFSPGSGWLGIRRPSARGEWQLVPLAQVGPVVNIADAPQGVTVAPDERHVLVHVEERALLLELPSGRELATFRGDRRLNATFSSDGKTVIGTSGTPVVELWPVGEPGAVKRFTGADGPISGAKFDVSNSRLVGVGPSALWLWRLDQPDKPRRLHWYGELLSSPSFSPDGSIVAANAKGAVLVWRTDGENEPVVIPKIGAMASKDRAVQMAFAPDGKSLAIATEHGVSIRTTPDFAEGSWIPAEDPQAPRFSSDGARLIIPAASGFRVLTLRPLKAQLKSLRERTSVCLTPRERATLLAESTEQAEQRYRTCSALVGAPQ